MSPPDYLVGLHRVPQLQGDAAADGFVKVAVARCGGRGEEAEQQPCGGGSSGVQWYQWQ